MWARKRASPKGRSRPGVAPPTILVLIAATLHLLHGIDGRHQPGSGLASGPFCSHYHRYEVQQARAEATKARLTALSR